jgi:alkylhydroperoxidase/carboxymuconolactone decarboxylase family protein YurZ
MAAQSTDTPVLDLLTAMTAESIKRSSLDERTLMLVRIAALVAVDAPPASFLMNLGAADEVGLEAEELRGVLAAVAPIVGTARVVSAAGNIARGVGREIELAELGVEVEA